MYRFTRLFMRYPKVAGVFGLVFAVLFASVAVGSLREVQRLPSTPKTVSISDVAALASVSDNQDSWVTIENGILDCRNIRYWHVGSDTRTQILVSDRDATTVVIAAFSGPLSCEQIVQQELSGTLSRMSDVRYQRFLELDEYDLSAFRNDAVYVDLCAFCGRSNSAWGVIVGGVLAVVALSIYPLSLRAHRKNFPKQSDH